MTSLELEMDPETRHLMSYGLEGISVAFRHKMDGKFYLPSKGTAPLHPQRVPAQREALKMELWLHPGMNLPPSPPYAGGQPLGSHP